MQSKQSVRQYIYEQRKPLCLSSIQEESKNVIRNIIDLPVFHKSKGVFTYVSFHKEVRTHSLIEEIWKTGKTCFVPKVNRETMELEVFEIQQWLDLKRGYKGILEPKKYCKKIEMYSTLDLAIIPGVAFDREGYRLGYGKGFFDKLLNKFPDTIKKIGVAFSFQLIDQVPHEKHDEKVHTVIVEE